MKKCVLFMGERWTAMFALAFVLLFTACSKDKEELAPLDNGLPGTTRSVEQDGTGGVTDDTGGTGISDDGDDEGDKERNKKLKGNNSN